ncbi:m7GpppX diphosphatase-like [Centruroides sculpturatus]|uniref:m7GpppX diphosphatase-like n=1 Tax=Centruroides sculpturatus TaxID=218467 RepID=UPI000C6CB372|nr:m7GpppX diphosphatase-like [Centruroides sculpturatus]
MAASVNNKKRKIEDSKDSVHDTIENLENFRLKRILSEDTSNKIIFLEGSFAGDDRSAVLILEKTSFVKDKLSGWLSGETSLQKVFANDIYGSYQGFTKADLNSIKATIIHPASEKHIQKYSHQPLHFITETIEMYKNVTLPYLETKQFSLQWVYNILEHKSEVDRIICEDDDPDVGFILIPDLKWDENQKNSLYIVAVCRKKGLRSLRDLTAEHIPLLKNIKSKCLVAIKEKYDIPPSQILSYLHYQPSYYHLHIHFTALMSNIPGTKADRAHLVDSVISNLEIASDYYQKVTLCYSLKDDDDFLKILQKQEQLCSDKIE